MGIGDKIKDVAHKMGIGHTGDEPASSTFGSSYTNVGATYGAQGAPGIAGPVAPGAATTASDIAAGEPVNDANYDRNFDNTSGVGTGAGMMGSGMGTGMAGTGAGVMSTDTGYGTGDRTGYGESGYGAQGVTTEGRSAEGVVCGQEHFTKIEDRPIVKERRTLVQEHHPVEKEFVVETRATGTEREMGTQGVESLGTEERVVGSGVGQQVYEGREGYDNQRY